MQNIEIYGGAIIKSNSRTHKIRDNEYVVGENVANYYLDRLLQFTYVHGSSEKSENAKNTDEKINLSQFPYLRKIDGTYKTTSNEIIKYIIDKSELGDILMKKLDELKQYINSLEDTYISNMRKKLVSPTGETKFIKIQIFEINCGDLEYTKYNPQALVKFINCVIDYINNFRKNNSIDSNLDYTPIDYISCDIQYPKNEQIEIPESNLSSSNKLDLLKVIEEPYVKLAKSIEEWHIVAMEKISAIMNARIPKK